MRLDNNQQAFFALLRAGLWEQDVRLLSFGEIDYAIILQLAEVQSIVGLLAAGIEHIVDTKPKQKDVMQFIGRMVQLEQRNQSMNCFIGAITEKMHNAGITVVLVKGQGVGQCYVRSLWRSCGDVDLLLDSANYHKAKGFLLPLSSKIDVEDTKRLHLGITIDPWLVELHGTLHSGYLSKMDKLIDDIQNEVLKNGRIRIWKNDSVDVKLPAPNEDVVIVFAHILQHYLSGGIGLRQICDWCRLLWVYRSDIDKELLSDRLIQAGLLSKWKAFAYLAVNLLGMPVEAMPLYSDSKKWRRKSERILTLVMESGNFGQGRDKSYKERHSAFISCLMSFWAYTRYHCIQLTIFPLDAVKGWVNILSLGINSFIKKNKGFNN